MRRRAAVVAPLAVALSTLLGSAAAVADEGGASVWLPGQFASFALDCLETAVFVLDGDSRVRFASAAARRLLDDGRLHMRNGQLGSPIIGESTALRRLASFARSFYHCRDRPWALQRS